MIETIRDIEVTEKQGIALDYLLDNKSKYILYGGAAGGGKTYLAMLWLIFMCYWYPGSRFFLGREELKRIRESALITFYKIVKDYKLPRTNFSYNGQDHFILFTNGSRIDLLDLKYLPSDPLFERFGSIEYTSGVIEEGGEVDFGAFDVLKTRVGRWRNDEYNVLGKILITANPKKNWLYKIIYKPYSLGELNPNYVFIPALAIENRFLDSGYLSNLDSITDNVTKQRLKFGNWEYDDDPSVLIEFDRIIDLFTNQGVPGGESFISADIARKGKDKTTIARWSGFRVEEIRTFTKSLTTETAARIREIASQHGIPMSRVIVDEDGVGGGVVDQLRCKGFINNSRPIQIKNVLKPANYANLKSQCGFMFAEKVSTSGIFINCPDTGIQADIIEELEQLKHKDVDSEGKLSLMSKDEVKERIGRSPDYSDMLIMRMYFTLNMTAKVTAFRIS